MKRIGVLIVLLIGFSAMNGYGAGNKQLSQKLDVIQVRVDTIGETLKTIQNDKTLEDRVKKLEDSLLDNEGSKNKDVPQPMPKKDKSPAISKNILLEKGQGYLTQGAIIDYMEDHNRSSWFSRRDISALVKAYFELAKEEGVNHEIAIAQMLYATRDLSRDDLLKSCNYAGLNAVAKGTFKDRDMGVRAHIQHLKGYASTVRPKNIVDPRYKILVANDYLGKGGTLEKLSVWWAPNNTEYEANISSTLRDLYQHQYQYDSRL